jgi:uncharacterized repeat protein (TIGR01451 family)
VRRHGLYTAVLLLGAVLPAWDGRCAAQPLPAAPDPRPGQTIIAVSHSVPQAPAPVLPRETLPAVDLKVLPAVIGTSQRPPPAPSPSPPPPGMVTAEATAQGQSPPAAAGPVTGSQTATVCLETTTPATHNAGKALAYEIIVRNPGTTAVQGVRVQEELAAGVRCLHVEPPADARGNQLLWSLGELEAGGERRLQVEVQPPAEGEFQSTATVTFATTAARRTRVTRPQLALEKTGPATAVVGDKVPFTIKVSNTGTGPVAGVVVHDTLPPELQHPAGGEIEADVGTLGPGETKTIRLEPTAIKAGRIVNEAVATSEDGQRATARAEVQLLEAALVLRKTGPREALIGHELDHRLEVVNPGQVPATNVTLTDVLPEGLDFVSASDGGTYDAGKRECSWALGTLEPGQTRGVSIAIRARAPGEWLNQAVARADRGLEAKAGQSVEVGGAPGITLEVVDLDDPVELGSETTYEIRVVNQGGCSCQEVRVTADVPAGLQVLGAEGPTDHRIDGQRVVFEPLPKLAARADAVYRVKVKARQAGEWHFVAYMQTAHMQRPVMREESTMVYNDAETDRLPGTRPVKRSGEPSP